MAGRQSSTRPFRRANRCFPTCSGSYSHPAVYTMTLPARASSSEWSTRSARGNYSATTFIAFRAASDSPCRDRTGCGGHPTCSSSKRHAWGRPNLSSTVDVWRYTVGIKLFKWTATTWGGRASRDAPMCYAFRVHREVHTTAGDGLPLARSAPKSR